MNIVLILLFFLIVTGCAILFYKLTRLTTEESVVAAIAGIIIVLFISGIFNNLKIGTYSIYFFSAIGWLLLFFGHLLPTLVYRHKPSLAFFSPGYIMFFLFFCYAVITLREASLYIRDEYSVWGRVVKHMYTTNTFALSPVYLGGSETNPPGTSLFHYLMTRVAGYNEGNMYISNFMLVSAGLFLPMFRVTWKKWYKVFVYGAFIFSCLFLFGKYPYRSLLVDNSTAAWAGGIAAWIFLRKNKKGTLILPALAFFVLPLFKKNFGLMLTFMILIFWMILYLISSRQSIRHRIKDTFTGFFREKKYLYLCFIIIPLIGIIVYNMILQSGTTFYMGNEAISDILGSTDYSERLSATLDITFYKFFHERETKLLTTFQILIFWVAVSILMNLTIPDKFERKRFIGMNVMLILGFFVFLGTLIYAYINIFSLDEGNTATAYDRYMSIYVIMGMVLLFSSIIVYKRRNKRPLIRYGLWAAVIGIAVSPLFSNSFFDQVSPSGLYKDKEYKRAMGIRVTAEEIMKNTNQEDQIYLVAQDRSGFELEVARYMMDGRVRLGKAPNRYIQNVMEPGTATNLRLQTEMTMEDFIERIIDGEYKYLWVYETNDYFNTFESLFQDQDIQENALYDIRRKDGCIMFYLKEKY